jgi:hypothetical protein
MSHVHLLKERVHCKYIRRGNPLRLPAVWFLTLIVFALFAGNAGNHKGLPLRNSAGNAGNRKGLPLRNSAGNAGNHKGCSIRGRC